METEPILEGMDDRVIRAQSSAHRRREQIVSAMDLKVNGESGVYPHIKSVADLLVAMNIESENARGIAVAVNDSVVRRKVWGSTFLADGDSVEIVTAQQGG